MESGSITNELLNYFDISPETPTASAFVQQRNKLKPEAFELFDIDGAAQILSGEYCVYTGTSQPDKRSKTLTGKGGFVN